MFEVFGLVSNPSDQIVSVISFLRLLLKEPLNSMHSVAVSYQISYLVQDLFCNMSIFRSLI